MPNLIQIIEKTPVPDITVQSALREIDTSQLAISMLGFDENEQEAILRNMSRRASALLLEEVEAIKDRHPPFTIAEEDMDLMVDVTAGAIASVLG